MPHDMPRHGQTGTERRDAGGATEHAGQPRAARTRAGDMPPRLRDELILLITAYADSALAGAAGFADVINLAPSLRERMATARITLEKIRSAERVLEVLSGFGAEAIAERYDSFHPWSARLPREADIGAARHGDDRRFSVLHYPLEGWTDAVVMHHLMGRAALIQMEDFTHAGYVPLAEAFRAVIPDETRHGVLAREGVSRELARGHHAAVQASVTYWWPRVAETFGHARSRRDRDLRHLGLRRRPNETLRRQWEAEMRAHLDRLHLTTPMQV